MIEQTQSMFQGVDAQSPTHLIGEGECASATNIDFSYERGAAAVRRGSTLYHDTGVSTNVRLIYRHYNNPNNIDASPYYYFLDNGAVVRFVGTATATVVTGSGAANCAASSFRTQALISANAGANRIKDDGTAALNWINPAPSAPTITLTTCAAIGLSTGTWTVAEGTALAATGTLTASTTGTNYRIAAGLPLTTTNLATNGSFEIGDYGLDFVEILFNNPSYIYSCSRDYSIADANFVNYYHTDLDIESNDNPDAYPSPETVVEGEVDVDSETRDEMAEGVRQSYRPPITRISAAGNTFNTWVVARPNFEFVGKYTSTSGADAWANIQAVRIVVEGSAPFSIQVRNWEVRGSKGYPLNDVNVGYAWWQTYATIDSNGLILGEGAPSAATDRFKCQFSQATIVAGTGTSTNHGITHSIWYRQGGYLKDAYAVGSSSISNGTTAIAASTFTDTFSDVTVLSEGRKLQWDTRSATFFPNHVVTMSPPFYNRVFVGAENKVYWSLPGQPDSFPFNSYTEVSHTGDNIAAIHASNNSLVIVNRDSVYELFGSVFEGRDRNWQLTRSGSKHGSKAPKTCINTPYGIVILDYDGIYLYQPGSGQEVLLDWAMQRISDAFGGDGAGDPASMKGARIPAINKAAIINSCAAFANNKLYLAVPINSNQQPSLVFVLDASTQKVWWYMYYVSITSMFWDAVDNRLLAGTTTGKIVRLETGTTDTDGLGGTTGIGWRVQTRAWTVPNDVVLENVAVEVEGGVPIYLSANFDNAFGWTSLSTFTHTTRDWRIPTIGGTFANSVAFRLQGTQGTGTSTQQHIIHQLGWDGIVHPKRVQYYRTDHVNNNYVGEKLWDMHVADIEVGVHDSGTGTCTVLGTVFVDERVVMTHTIVNGSGIGTATDIVGGRQIHQTAFPSNTFGDISYTVFNVPITGTGTAAARPAGHYFKLWKHDAVGRNEPPRLSVWKTDIQSGEESIVDAMDVDIAPHGTVTSTVFVDNTATATFTTTGTNQQSYTYALPNETYGRTVYAIHTGGPFKHYRTWFHLRAEPDRWTNFVSDKDVGEEHIWDSVGMDINFYPSGTALGTVLATAIVDGSSVGTFTLTGTATRTSVVKALPPDTFGRAAWVVYNAAASGKAKHYQTWFNKRPEPPRVATFVTPRLSGNERWWQTFETDIDPLGGTVISTVVIDGTGYGTYTSTGSGRRSYAHALPAQTYGRTITALHSGSQLLKHYNTWFDGPEEPDRLSFVESPPQVFPSNHNLRTWVVELNPLGTVVGTVIADNTVLQTATFTGTSRTSFNVGMDVTSAMALQTATALSARYTASGVGAKLKHYQTNFETEPEPFSKQTWSVTYRKVGGASQLDIGRFWEIEGEGTATVTSVWDVDGTAVLTNTLAFTNQEWKDRISFPPGIRGYLFQQRLYSSSPIRVHTVSLDTIQIGRKGVVARSWKGVPK